MKISKEHMFTLMHEGYITLQIPNLVISFDNNYSDPNAKDVPDEWFSILRSSGNRPVIGKEQGFLYFSKAGWKANKKEIKEAFLSSPNPRGTWEEFEEYVKKHFKNAELSIHKEIAKLKKRIYELINVTL